MKPKLIAALSAAMLCCFACAVPAFAAVSAVPAQTYAPGDVDMDGAVTPRDAQLVLKCAVNMTALLPCSLTEEQVALSHILGTEQPDRVYVQDAQAILVYSVKKLSGCTQEELDSFFIKYTAKLPPLDADDGCQIETPRARQIEVQNILQNPELPTGCECVSLTILLNYLGYPADKMTMARTYLPKQSFYWENGELYGADFRTTFAGDPESADSYGCYAPCIVTTANRYFAANGYDAQAADLTGTDFDTLLTDCIDRNLPVVIWITGENLHEPKLTTVWRTPAGERLQWRSFEHCVVLTGYDKDKGLIYVSDPLIGNTSYDYSRIRQRYLDMGQQAVTVRQ
ncbi:MAG: C39 family peptidase [Oscillospiraceae bacterium]|nr:C39 family peptidase [Oscillospiraceae bacterium]